MRGEGSVAVYVHVPWCLSRCPYCDFNTVAARSWPEDEYAAALLRELDGWLDEAPWRGAGASSVFFGGGTPSLFRPDTIGALLHGIDRRLPLAPDAEITLEANPGTLDEGRLRGFRAAGVNRLSLGAQTFDDGLLATLGRRHSAADSRRAAEAARRAGFDNLSIDLIWAIPGQDLEGCLRDLDAACALAPEHVSAYGLTYEPGTPMRRARDQGQVRAVDEDLEVAMLLGVRERLATYGYEAYEVSNFSRPGREARHNQAYWRGVPYLGLGAGAHSFSPGDREADPAAWGRRWSNVRDASLWMEQVRAQGRAVAESESLLRDQARAEWCWLSLRQSEGLDVEDFTLRFGRRLEEELPVVVELVASGLLRRDGPRLSLTREGLLVADSVFASFFA